MFVQPIDAPTEDFDDRLERASSAFGLLIERTTLLTHPGSVHWHLRRPQQKGTLEVTWLPDKSRAWFAVHANRQAPWIEDAIVHLLVLAAEEAV